MTRKTPEEKKAEKSLYDKNRLKDPLISAANKTRSADYRRDHPLDLEGKKKKLDWQRRRRADPVFKASENARRQKYRDNPVVRAKELSDTRILRKNRLRKLNLLKMDRPCYDCGGVFPPEAMDWDHLPGAKKCFSIGEGLSRSLNSVIDEIAKCQLVCANCHRMRTAKRGNR